MKNVKLHLTDVFNEEEVLAYAESHLSGIERLLGDTNIKWNLRIGREEHKNTAHVFFAEARIATDKKTYGARAKADSVNAAIDKLKDELHNKIAKHKDKKRSLFKEGARRIKNLLQS